MSYTEAKWRAELATYDSARQAIEETFEGVSDHLDQPCGSDATQTVYSASSPVGLAERPTVCDRGTRGCPLEHNDRQALEFARMGLERAAALLEEAR